MNNFSVYTPVETFEPRGARAAGKLFSQVFGWFQRSRRAQAERRQGADRATEAAAVRDYAQRFASHDPRFAADLLAAADRHEITV